MTDTKPNGIVPKWGRFEQHFVSTNDYINPIQDVSLKVRYISPSGRESTTDGFWNGKSDWLIRFSPDELGNWTYSTTCSDVDNKELHKQEGQFICVQSSGANRFDQHGPIRLSNDHRHLIHADGTPFFFLGDTAWNGPLRATQTEWAHYLRERVRQKFTAVQWVTTQWLASPEGDLNDHKPFNGIESITLNPEFFQRLDTYVEAIDRAGLLNVPVMLWAAEWRSTESNPGYFLPEDQAILLGRYMLARWGAYPLIWILPGDSDYRGAKADRWKRIGQGIFGDEPHAPVSLHPGGMQWNADEFRNEEWLDILGYQSGHGDDEKTLEWLVCGPPATDWVNPPSRPFINLEPPYEDHIAYQSQTRISADFTRRALYWSLLVSPTAGVTYGGHGIWGWDDGTATPVAHPNTGVPKPWQEALLLEGAEQVKHLSELFESFEWWRLRPSPELIASQPGDSTKSRFVSASRSEKGDLALIYIPQDREISLNLDSLADDLSAIWFDPRNGSHQSASLNGGSKPHVFQTPAPGDWILLLGRSVSLPAQTKTGTSS